jgi:hypothetical protein
VQPPCNHLIEEYTESLSLSLILRPTVSRLVCLGMKYLLPDFITVRSCGFVDVGRSLWRKEGVCHLQLLLVLASAVILGSESRRTRDRTWLSQIRDFPLRRLLRLAGLLCVSLTVTHCTLNYFTCLLITTLHGPKRNHRYQQFLCHCYGPLLGDSPDVFDMSAGRYKATAVVPQFASRSQPSNGSICHSIN